MAKYKYQPHPHASTRQPVELAPRGFNSRLGVLITKAVGTMWAAYKDATLLLHEVKQLQQHLEHQDAPLAALKVQLGAGAVAGVKGKKG